MKRFLIGAAALAGMSLSALAPAQVDRITDATPYNFSFRGGWVLPIDDKLSDFADSLIGIGVDYIPPTQFLRGSETFFSIDYIFKSTSGKKGSIFPIHVNQRFYSDPATKMGSYWLVGVGAHVFDIEGTKTGFGGRVGLGVRMSDQLFLESSAFFSEEVKNVRNVSIGVHVGYRF
mgnify:CR=1 FL=1